MTISTSTLDRVAGTEPAARTTGGAGSGASPLSRRARLALGTGLTAAGAAATGASGAVALPGLEPHAVAQTVLAAVGTAIVLHCTRTATGREEDA